MFLDFYNENSFFIRFENLGSMSLFDFEIEPFNAIFIIE